MKTAALVCDKFFCLTICEEGKVKHQWTIPKDVERHRLWAYIKGCLEMALVDGVDKVGVCVPPYVGYRDMPLHAGIYALALQVGLKTKRMPYKKGTIDNAKKKYATTLIHPSDESHVCLAACERLRYE